MRRLGTHERYGRTTNLKCGCTAFPFFVCANLQFIRSQHPLRRQPLTQRRGLSLHILHTSVQLSGANHPTAVLAEQSAEHFEIVSAAIEHMDGAHALLRRTDEFDHASPDFRLPGSPRSLIRVFVFRHRLAIEQFLPGQSDDFFRVGGDHQRVVQQKSSSAAVTSWPQTVDVAVDPEVRFGRVPDQKDCSAGVAARQSPVRCRQCRKT